MNKILVAQAEKLYGIMWKDKIKNKTNSVAKFNVLLILLLGIFNLSQRLFDDH
jgi:hypothetical protein